MLTLILAFLGGVLTILSPCVLPVVPLIFARSDQPFRRSGLPMLFGMGISFASFAALTVVGGSFVVHANQIGRTFALIVFAVLGLSLVWPQLAERLSAPFVRLGGALQSRADAKSGLAASLLLGASVGLLWAPCAGPILGLVLAGAALGESTRWTFVLLLAFALGAATSLGVAIFAGGKVLRILKKGFGAQEWIRRALGVAVLGAVAAIALRLDTRLLSKLSYLNTGAIEQSLVDRVTGTSTTSETFTSLPDEGPMPSLGGATEWLNSPPLSPESLRGKVVLVDFWTYSCINCLRTLPYVKAWAEKYGERGLVVVGIHTPEFAFEKDVGNVKNAVRELEISYPVALDNEERVWAAFKNRYWPAHYFIDAGGRIRFHHFGEGGYVESEQVIEELLGERPGIPVSPTGATGTQASVAGKDAISPETYVGYARQEGFVSVPTIQRNVTALYRESESPRLNHWTLTGRWNVSSEMASSDAPGAAVSFRFLARDLHLVIGAATGAPVRYRITLDGQSPGKDHGEDVDLEGNGTVRGHRLYQLVRQREAGRERTFRIEFLDQGAEVYAFTFG